MGALMELRKTHKDEFEQVHGVKLGFMSAVVQGLDGGGFIGDAGGERLYRRCGEGDRL